MLAVCNDTQVIEVGDRQFVLFITLAILEELKFLGPLDMA